MWRLPARQLCCSGRVLCPLHQTALLVELWKRIKKNKAAIWLILNKVEDFISSDICYVSR
jgi:hypothetical protein